MTGSPGFEKKNVRSLEDTSEKASPIHCRIYQEKQHMPQTHLQKTIFIDNNSCYSYMLQLLLLLVLGRRKN